MTIDTHHNLSNYIANYCNEAISRDIEIDASVIADAINAFEGGASETCKRYQVTVRLDRPIKAEDDRINAYNEYYDTCERANKSPMTFDNWQKQQKG